MCRGIGCLLARFCKNFTENAARYDDAFDHCDEEYRSGFVSTNTLRT